MVDLELIYSDLCAYLGGKRIRANPPREPREPAGGAEHEANVHAEDGHAAEAEDGEEEFQEDDSPDGNDGGEDLNGDDIVHRALNGIPLNGQIIDHGNAYERVHPEPEAEETNEEDDDMGTETYEQRRRRYLEDFQDQVSNPDEWADLHYGHLDNDAYDRMIAYSRANRIRFQRAATTLMRRHDDAARVGNWEEAAGILRTLRKVEALMDIA
eukprot:s4016_g4.t1